MTKKLGLSAIAVLALGLAGTAVAGNQDDTKTGTKGQERKPTPGEMKESEKGAQRTKAETDSVRLTSLEKGQIKNVQGKLKDLGLYKEDADGNLGASTRAALSRYFNMQLTLLNQDRISNSSLSAFGFDQDEIQKVRGVDEKRATEREPTKGTEPPKQKHQREQPNQDPQK